LNTVFNSMLDFSRSVLSGIIPYTCPGCGRPGKELVCPDCERKIKYIGEPWCRVCGRQLPPGVSFTDGCRECEGGGFHFDRCRSAMAYEGAVDGAVKKFKFHRNVHMGYYLCRKMSDFISEQGEMFEPLRKADALVPVPLHPFRFLRRGFNQSEMIAREASGALGVPVLPCLARTRHTRPQSLLKAEERIENVQGAFAVKKKYDLPGMRLVVVDDVMTTGATVNECSRVLGEAGAEEVHVLTAARRI